MSWSRRMAIGVRASVVGGTMVAIAAPVRTAHAAKPTQIVPQKKKGKERRQARRADIDRSEGGERRGVLELSLGSVVLATSGLLVGRGIWEITTSRQRAIDCQNGTISGPECTVLSPETNGAIAAGLSFGFAALLAGTSGFLLARGIRINRDYRKWKANNVAFSVRPWASVRRPAGGVSVSLRF
ncbi:MAG: hypothetical protein AAF799_12970 [Myxococcota bacterium]